MLLSGTVPPLADAYYPREQSGPDLASSMRPGETAVLVHGGETEVALATSRMEAIRAEIARLPIGTDPFGPRAQRRHLRRRVVVLGVAGILGVHPVEVLGVGEELLEQRGSLRPDHPQCPQGGADCGGISNAWPRENETSW